MSHKTMPACDCSDNSDDDAFPTPAHIEAIVESYTAGCSAVLATVACAAGVAPEIILEILEGEGVIACAPDVVH